MALLLDLFVIIRAHNQYLPKESSCQWGLIEIVIATSGMATYFTGRQRQFPRPISPQPLVESNLRRDALLKGYGWHLPYPLAAATTFSASAIVAFFHLSTFRHSAQQYSFRQWQPCGNTVGFHGRLYVGKRKATGTGDALQ